MSQVSIQTIPTTPFEGQRPGTSGLRKKTRIFMQPHYLENFVQAVFDMAREDPPGDFRQETLVIGGDGRYYNRTAIQTILRMAVANGFGRALVARGGILSTPAMSAVIRRHGALGGLVLSASHNPGGIDEDFGIKFNARNGGPAPERMTERIFAHTKGIREYRSVDTPDYEIDREGKGAIGTTEVVVFDGIADYAAVMESLFDFAALRALFRRGFRLRFDAMHGVTGPYARYLFETVLGAPSGSVVNGIPLEDFGGGRDGVKSAVICPIVPFYYEHCRPNPPEPSRSSILKGYSAFHCQHFQHLRTQSRTNDFPLRCVEGRSGTSHSLLGLGARSLSDSGQCGRSWADGNGNFRALWSGRFNR